MEDPFHLSDRDIALQAAINAGLCPECKGDIGNPKFLEFWSNFQTDLAKKRTYELHNTLEMLNQERQKRANDRAEYRRYYLNLTISMVLGLFFGVFLTEVLMFLF